MLSTAVFHSFINCLLANTYKLSAATNSNLYKRPIFLDTSLVPIKTMPSAAAIECTSSKGIFVCPWLTNTAELNLKEYTVPSVLEANTAAPPSTIFVKLCVGSTSTMLSPSANQVTSHASKGLFSQMYSAVPSLPVIHNLFFTYHTPVNPPELDCAVVNTV